MSVSDLADTVNEFRESLWAYFESRLTAGVQTRYANARRFFDNWCVERRIDVSRATPEDLDVLVARCSLDAIEDVDGRHSRQQFLDLLASLQRRHSYKFRMSAKVLTEWSKDTPPRQAAAFPEIVGWAIVSFMALGMNQPEAAVTSALCFTPLLRIGEAINLMYNDVSIPRSAGDAFQIVFILNFTQRCFDQRVVLTNPAMLRFILAYIKRHARPGRAFAPMSYPRYSRILTRACQCLGLPAALDIRSHSWRRSGATALVERGYSVVDVQNFGRWASDRSCREYLRLGQSALTRSRRDLSDDFFATCGVLASALQFAFAME